MRPRLCASSRGLGCAGQRRSGGIAFRDRAHCALGTRATVPLEFPTVREEILDRDLDESVKAYRPPRFLLNDIVRYWRTICVDFAGKEHEGPRKWGLRNAKLRTSREILFAGGLLPTLECFRYDSAEMRSYLEAQLELVPTDRIAQCFVVHEAVEPGARTLGAYDEFIRLMNNEDFRRELSEVVRDTSGDSAAFADVRRIGRDLQGGLLALLHGTRTLPQVAREYAIFWAAGRRSA
jgi:hypothetical protein